MNPTSKMLIGAGVVLVIMGLGWHLGSKFFPLGRLPGDIVVERENFKFYFPVMTSILLSVGLTLVLYLIQFFRK